MTEVHLLCFVMIIILKLKMQKLSGIWYFEYLTQHCGDDNNVKLASCGPAVAA